MSDGMRETLVTVQADDGPMSALCLFGDEDTGIPPAEVDVIRIPLTLQPREHPIIVDPGEGHGFFCDERAGYDRHAAEGAPQRTRAWLELRLKALASFPTED